jgi:hypothetical protein
MGAVVASALALVVALSPAFAGLLSKNFMFKEDVVLRIGVETAEGIRLENVRFGKVQAGRGSAEILAADVTVSNPYAEGAHVGIALALFDDEGRLVGAANAGPETVRGSQTKVFHLSFAGLGVSAATAKTFQISLEVP